MTKPELLVIIGSRFDEVKEIMQKANVKSMPPTLDLETLAKAKHKNLLHVDKLLHDVLPLVDEARRVRRLVPEEIWARYILFDLHDLREIDMWDSVASRLRRMCKETKVWSSIKHLMHAKTTKGQKVAKVKTSDTSDETELKG